MVTATLLAVLMLASVVLANRIGPFSDFLLTSVLDSPTGVNIRVSMSEEDGEIELAVIDEEREASEEVAARAEQGLASPPVAAAYEVVPAPDTPPEAWEFSREWSFNPPGSNDTEDADDGVDLRDLTAGRLNPALSVVHGILLLILLITSANYLLSALYDDRKDRSILFWRSMPVSEWEIVLSKFVVAMVLAPLLYIAISLLLQLAYVILMMMLVWRMNESPGDTVLANIDFTNLMVDPISGWLLTALWIAPTYAWLLLASAAARRSPFMIAVLPIIALAVIEAIFMGSDRVLSAVQNHFPHATDSSAVGFYLFGPTWTRIDLGAWPADCCLPYWH